jgi:hypothetical protein
MRMTSWFAEPLDAAGRRQQHNGCPVAAPSSRRGQTPRANRSLTIRQATRRNQSREGLTSHETDRPVWRKNEEAAAIEAFFLDPLVDGVLVALGRAAPGTLHGPAEPVAQQRPHVAG